MFPLPGADKALRLYAEGVGDAVDVVEIGDHLCCVVKCAIVETVGAQGVEIGGRHGVRAVGELDRILAQRPVGGRQRRLAPVVGDQVHKVIRQRRIGGRGLGQGKVGDLSTEVVGMSAPSVGALVGGGNDCRQQLALSAAEG